MNALTNLKNDGLWGSYYDQWSAAMEHVVQAKNMDVYLAAVPLIRDWRKQFVEIERIACKGARYNRALKRELDRPIGRFHKLTIKEFSELVWLSNDGNDDRLVILAELRAERKDTAGMRDINTPKAAAKIVREELARREAEEDGSADEARTQAEQEQDAADALVDKMLDDDAAGGGALVSLMRRHKDPYRVMEAFLEAFRDQPSQAHACLVRAVEELRVNVNEIIEAENADRPEGETHQKPWGELGGAFLKPMRAHKLLKQPCRG